MGEQGNTRREIAKDDGEYSQRSLRGCCETKARALGWARSFAEGGGSRAGGARGGCSHLPPGLASPSAGSEGRWGGTQPLPTLLWRGPDADPLPALAHLGDEFTLLDIHKPLRAMADVDVPFFLSLAPVLQCLAVTPRHYGLGRRHHLFLSPLC